MDHQRTDDAIKSIVLIQEIVGHSKIPLDGCVGLDRFSSGDF